jgi:hypothetical protein
MLMSVFEDREGSIWVGTATTGVDRFQRKPLPFKRYRNEPGNPQSLLRTSVTSVYADSQENIWVGSALGLTRIDGKSGEYSFFRKAGSAPKSLSNTFVISIVEDRSGFLWVGTCHARLLARPNSGVDPIFETASQPLKIIERGNWQHEVSQKIHKGIQADGGTSPGEWTEHRRGRACAGGESQ